jgi:hypothetical protein
MTELLIVVGIGVVIGVALFVYALKTAPQVKEEPKKVHEVRKVTFVVSETEKPKKKKKKYYNKKKATLAESATPVAKRPVGRPRKTTE